MFFEANERWKNNKLFSSDGYVRDILKQYGNGGRPIQLPKVSQEMYEDGLRFRDAEKRHYSSLEQQMAAAKTTAASREKELLQLKYDNEYMATVLEEFLKNTTEDAPSGDWHSERELGSNGGDYVLPSKDRPSADDSNLGQSEAIISSTEAGHEPSRARSNRSRRDNAQLHTGKEGGEDGTQGSDPGRAPPDATNGAESDVGGPADQHRAEE